ncbi:phospholipase D family protein [Moraxella bovoculi]|uniref:phospholipase D family protein n=1 Tax=Moraxella bovoculi TaxID=386891 RepID=UPI000624AC62|nr:phospholipase D family protein [Moraxella bovoculi]AKG17075.1 phospholipase D family protein [Moraxella bovoculi]
MINALHASYTRLIAIGLFAALLSACQSLPNVAHLDKSLAITQKSQLAHAQQIQTQRVPVAVSESDLRLGDVIDEQRQDNPHLSGYYPIATGANAFASRSILSDMATKTIDIQYYIWHNDEAGQMMVKDLWEAAERGVMVRLLLDDFNSSPKLDELLLAFAKHPNVAVRLANPMVYRKFRTVNYLISPTRINRRMHNKSMTFDNQLSIIGGRNIGDEYLNNAKNNNFTDMDVLLIGPVVDEITTSFEEYWAASSSYDIETIVKPSGKTITDVIDAAILQNNYTAMGQQAHALRTYRRAVETSTISEDLLNKRVPFRWAKIEFLADDASKLTKTADLDTHLVGLLQERLGRPNQRLSIISSYFVPTRNGVRTLKRLAKSGVKISILTNSFDATDVGAVHAGYGHWRHDLLSAGVDLYELKSTAVNDKQDDNKFWRTKQITTTSLHAKAFAVDHEQVFIGSYNIDPRSANFNTELGVMIYDERLAEQLHNALRNQRLLNQAYKVVLTKQNTLEWHTLEDGEYVIHKSEPNMNLKDRAGVAIMGTMPIDWLL